MSSVNRRERRVCALTSLLLKDRCQIVMRPAVSVLAKVLLKVPTNLHKSPHIKSSLICIPGGAAISL